MRKYIIILALWLAPGAAFAQGIDFDFGPSHHGHGWGERSHRMDRDYSERWGGRHRAHEEHHHLHGMPCVIWDEDEGTWRRVC